MNTTTTCVCVVTIGKECNYGNEVAKKGSFQVGNPPFMGEKRHILFPSDPILPSSVGLGERVVGSLFFLAPNRYVEFELN